MVLLQMGCLMVHCTLTYLEYDQRSMKLSYSIGLLQVHLSTLDSSTGTSYNVYDSAL